jgi:hypothetical protein
MFAANSTSDAFVDIQENDYKSLANTVFEKFQAGKLDNLTTRECIDAYAVNFQTQRGNVILVTIDNNGVAGAINYSDYTSALIPGSLNCASDPFDWICGQDGQAKDCAGVKKETVCSIAYKSIDPNNWSPMVNRVQYCLSEPLPGQCKVQFSVAIAYTVIMFNFCKALILFSAFFLVREKPLTTIGDAVTSFLDSADETTTSLCLMSHDKLALWHKPPVPQPYIRAESIADRRWSNTVSWKRWVLCMLL